MRVAFAGTPALAVPVLEALVAAGHEVPLVVSAPDKRRGRGGALTASPVKAAASALGLPVSADPAELITCGAEVGVVVAYGRLLAPPVVHALPLVNLHVSLLPRWRGAAPVEWAVLAGDAGTGVCVMEVTEGLDEGGVYARAERPIDEDVTVEELRTALVADGTRLLLELLSAGLPLPTPEPQQGEPTYARKLRSEEFRLDWSSDALDLHRRVRVGGAWTTNGDRRLKLHRTALVAGDEASAAVPEIAADASPGSVSVRAGRVFVTTGDGLLELLVVQPEGRGAMAAAAWANGDRPDGRVLGP